MNTQLPAWAETYSDQKLHILFGGFNPHWSAGKLERQIVFQIGQSFLAQHPNKTIHIVVPSWFEPDAVVNHIKEVNADIVAICSLTDPFGPIVSKLPDAIQIGYTTCGIPLDFWALACKKFFKSYTQEQLQPNITKLFLSYNRKPHPHRINLVQELKLSGLDKFGYVTLGGTDLTVGDTYEQYADSGAYDAVGDLNIPNDIYSLGQSDIWNSCLFNIVSETSPSQLFVSEKTFKPIIGMRPFIINGSLEILKWLQDAGFDCFLDLWPADNIVDNLKHYQSVDLQKLYTELLPRLENNRNKFFEYARHHTHKAINLLSTD